MKSILEFNLPEDQEEMQDALNGHKWRAIVQALDEELRQDIKYERGATTEDIRKTLRASVIEWGLEL